MDYRSFTKYLFISSLFLNVLLSQTATVKGVIKDSGTEGSETYTSGFAGAGWRIDQGVQETGKTSAVSASLQFDFCFINPNPLKGEVVGKLPYKPLAALGVVGSPR